MIDQHAHKRTGRSADIAGCIQQGERFRLELVRDGISQEGACRRDEEGAARTVYHVQDGKGGKRVGKRHSQHGQRLQAQSDQHDGFASVPVRHTPCD